jgi:hypothetical protein
VQFLCQYHKNMASNLVYSNAMSNGPPYLDHLPQSYHYSLHEYVWSCSHSHIILHLPSRAMKCSH